MKITRNDSSQQVLIGFDVAEANFQMYGFRGAEAICEPQTMFVTGQQRGTLAGTPNIPRSSVSSLTSVVGHEVAKSSRKPKRPEIHGCLMWFDGAGSLKSANHLQRHIHASSILRVTSQFLLVKPLSKRISKPPTCMCLAMNTECSPGECGYFRSQSDTGCCSGMGASL